ncbi:YigZ family protein [Bariatricus massiliensis]|uniref:YigZ family protein n=1 Tax=Bariatricus massiliensis TaxID=1745713 RepID=A0ABS8DJ00_9FIRM|nr:YigZ family protein [Bariatricus massiliensis]MCB7305270.1 YigZ family protein [Bariatricus massiliensis]MCB7375837.1 YigZ family protein [Bariatricus massiliensis]MCB7388413.1 YigZ family protein [Bariatricus massiliensis]MCB7412599.1 YigZ family protein [Bariatricus massiliensis]MCQ5254763.1 YigZ family protein [Bariatricus massiliensis]
MLLEYKTVYEGKESEIVEKKSRFIASVEAVATEEEAVEFIEYVRKKYWDARHHCFAYVIGENHELKRYNDDGEPGGTAGKPMLDVLLGEDIHNTVVVVTRYFGGTLLGTGGLVRAYQGATKAGINASDIITKKRGHMLEILTDYTGLGKIQYILGQRGLRIMDTEYTDSVKLSVLIPLDEEQAVIGEITEGTNGQAGLTVGRACMFAEHEKEILIFEE